MFHNIIFFRFLILIRMHEWLIVFVFMFEVERYLTVLECLFMNIGFEYVPNNTPPNPNHCSHDQQILDIRILWLINYHTKLQKISDGVEISRLLTCYWYWWCLFDNHGFGIMTIEWHYFEYKHDCSFLLSMIWLILWCGFILEQEKLIFQAVTPKGHLSFFFFGDKHNLAP